MKFCVGLGKSPVGMLKLIRNSEKMNPCSVSVVYKWHERFRNGRKSTEDNLRDGQPCVVRMPIQWHQTTTNYNKLAYLPCIYHETWQCFHDLALAWPLSPCENHPHICLAFLASNLRLTSQNERLQVSEKKKRIPHKLKGVVSIPTVLWIYHTDLMPLLQFFFQTLKDHLVLTATWNIVCAKLILWRDCIKLQYSLVSCY